MGRFGTTISSLPDLNGDGLRDVAVGAPLEDDKSGAVYIYHGNRQRGIVSTFSQVTPTILLCKGLESHVMSLYSAFKMLSRCSDFLQTCAKYMEIRYKRQK